MTTTNVTEKPARTELAGDQEQAARERTPWARYVLLYSIFFLMGAEMYLVSPLLPTISSEMHASTAVAAGLVTSYVLTYAIAGPLLGGLADRVERRWFVGAGVCIFLVGNILCALAPTLPLLIGARAVTGLGGAIAAPAIWAYLAEHAAPHQRGKVISLGASIYSLGQVLGVPLGAGLAGLASWRWPFACIGVLMLFTVPTVLIKLRGTKPDGARTMSAIVKPWRVPQIGLGLVSTALLQAGRLGTYSFAGVLFAEKFGFSLTTLGLVGLLVGLASLTGSLLTGPTIDRLRQRGVHEIWLSVGTAAVFTVAVLIAVLATQPVISLAALFVWFVAGGAFYSTQQHYLSTVDPKQRASVVSWNNSMMNAGIAFGTSLLSVLAVGSVGFAVLAGGFGLLATLLSLALVMRPWAARNGAKEANA
jgi:predicted MFS family arabinose efflux permease